MENEKSVKEILLKHGYIVTDKCFGGWNKGCRMITDLKGNEIGFYNPLDAVNELTKNKTKWN
jgi:hypothetical protein